MGDFSAEHEVMHHREATREVCAFANELRRQLGVEVGRLDLGGGFRATGAVLLSTPGAGEDVALHALPAPADYAEAIFSQVEAHLEVAEPPLVQFECGGGLVGDAVAAARRGERGQGRRGADGRAATWSSTAR